MNDELRLCLTVHFYPDRESFDTEKAMTLKFLMPNDGALSPSEMLSRAVKKARR